MIGRKKHDFPQEAFSAPFTTVLLSDLERALFANKLHNRIPRDPRPTKARSGFLGDGPYRWVRRMTHPLVREAKNYAAKQMLSYLRDGHLIAHMPTEAAGIFLRIPPQFWHERRSGLRIDGKLLDADKNILVPDEIDEETFCVLEESARFWLAERKINEENPAFPEALRTPKTIIGSRKKSGKPPSEIKKWCVKTGLAILSERGGISPNFRQVHLIDEIYKRRPKHWVDEEPSDASMKRYARQAIEQFTDATR